MARLVDPKERSNAATITTPAICTHRVMASNRVLTSPLNSPAVHLVFSGSVCIGVVRRELRPQLLGAVDTLLYGLRYQLFASVLTGITG